MNAPTWLIYISSSVLVVGLLRWLLYLMFCAWIVHRTGTSSSLRDVSVAARAFPGITMSRRRSGPYPGDETTPNQDTGDTPPDHGC